MAFSLRAKILSIMIMITFSGPVIAWAQTINPVQGERLEMENDCKSGKVMAIYSKDCPHTDCCISELAGKLNKDDLLKAAIKCRDSDNFNICDNDTKETYIIYLRVWKCELEKHLEDKKLDAYRKLEIRKEIISLDGRIKDIQAVTEEQCLKISCKDCNTKELCQERCMNNRERMEEWRNRYKRTMQGNQYLDCNECLKALEDYYNEQKEMFSANKLNENIIYTPEHLNVMWGLLYCLSPSTDKKKEMNQTCLEKAKNILPHVMLPFLLPSWELLQLLEDRLKKGDLTPEETRKIVEKKNQSIYIIKVLLELFNESVTISSRIPPIDLAAILSGLIDKNMASIQNIDIKKRLDFFTTFLNTLSEDDVKKYLGSNTDYQKKLAEFIKKAGPTVLESLISLDLMGFTNEELINLIKAQYEKYGEKEKAEFINLLLKIFDEETIIINDLFAERFFRIGDEEQKRIVEEKKYEVEIVRFLDNLRAVKPELLDCNIPNPPLKHKYLTSFFMPGYVRSYHEEKPSGIVKAWNYSNIALLGLAVVSEAAYINTDYDNDTLFNIGVTATVAFIVNGVLSVVDAANFPKKKNDSAGIAMTGPYISINGQDDQPALMFTFKY